MMIEKLLQKKFSNYLSILIVWYLTTPLLKQQKHFISSNWLGTTYFFEKAR